MSTGLGVLVRQPLWRRCSVASLLGRLPMTMSLLALVLVGERVSGSLAVGAQLAGVATVTAGLAAPLRGRRLDRRGLRDGLREAALATGVVLLAQAFAVAAGAPLALLYALAAAQGVAQAALSGGFRAMLGAVVAPEDLPRANTLEAVFVEIAFVAGPGLAGILALAVGPVGVLIAMAAASAVSAVLISALPRVAANAGTSSAPWRAPGAASVFAIAFALGVTFGVVESALPARAAQLGLAPATAGPLLALTAGGSAVGGLLAATRRDHRKRQGLVAVGLLAALGSLLASLPAAGTPVSLGLLLLLAGAPIAPLNALGALRLQDVVPAGRLGEGFAVFTAMILTGAGVGQIVTGQFLDDLGARGLLAGAAGVPFLLAGVFALVLAGRGRPSVRDVPVACGEH